MMTADGDVPADLSKLQQSYELVGELSRDELVTAYVARDRRTGQEVAIKVLRAADAQGREALAHYASDARMLTALEHPNIIAVHGVKWLSEDIVAVITEHVRGPSLRQVLDVAGTLPVARATEVLRGLARALAWAHSSQVMHRDLRPENVIFEDRTGRVVISDLGLARRIDVSQATNAIADAYRAPELADGRYPDRRSDVFSLGIVGWELLTGRRPWPDDMEPIVPGESAPQPPPLAEIRPGLPPALVAAIEGTVQLDRDRRIADVVTFMERLTTVAPPRREVADEEQADEAQFAPTEWVSLPVPRMPQRPSVADREVLRERGAEPAPSEQPSDARRARTVAPAPAPDVSTPEASTSVASASAASTTNVPPRDASLADAGAGARSTQDVPPRPTSLESVRVQAADIAVPEPRISRETPPATGTAQRELERPVGREAPLAEDRPEPDVVTRERRAEAATPPEFSSAPLAAAGPVPPAPRMSTAERKRQAKRDAVEESRGDSAVAREPAVEQPLASRADDVIRRETPQGDEPQREEPRRSEPRGDEPHASPAAAIAAGLAAGAVAAAAQAGSTREAARVDTPRTLTPRGEPVKTSRGRADTPPAKPPLADAPESDAPTRAAARADVPLADAPRGDAPRTESAPRAPFEPDERVAARWNKPLSDVELPPPEPVPFADTRAEPLTGPISGPSQSQSRPIERFEPAMRGGLATPRPPTPPVAKSRERKLRGKKRDSGSMVAPAPLQPLWDTPAEFPLPAMPDPRPMPADAGRGAPTEGRRRWTRRGIAIAAIVAVAVIGAITLARMERAPDTTADLMRPESPIGYGGDVSLDPRAADTATVPGAASARASEGAERGGSSGGAASSARTRNSSSATPPATSRATPAPATAAPSATRPGSTTPTRGATATTSTRAAAPTRSTPTGERRTGATTATTPRSAERATTPTAAVAATEEAEERPTGACGSPALADQRACLAAQIASADGGLNDVYGDLIVAMRRRANSAPGDPDPPEVQRLRAVQRRWLARRDAECRRRGRGVEGPLWATPRARCLAEFSAERSRELSATLARLRRD